MSTSSQAPRPRAWSQAGPAADRQSGPWERPTRTDSRRPAAQPRRRAPPRARWVGGVLVDTTGWQGLFWIDAGIAAACIPLTWFTVSESRDPNRPRSIDLLGTLLIAVILVPLVLALSEGGGWGWLSAATIGCLVISVLGAVGFVVVERRVTAPLVDLQLLRNPVLVGATLAILLVAGAINALMYVLSLYFQDPAGFGLSALQAGLATLPAAAAMIAVTPLITPIAVKIGPRSAVALGFGLAAVAFAALAFVGTSWTYAAFVLPLIAIAVGLGFANGPASSASTASVAPEEVGQASGISNMAATSAARWRWRPWPRSPPRSPTAASRPAPRRPTPSPPGSPGRRCCWRSCPPPASGWRCWWPGTVRHNPARSIVRRPRR
jgi:Major Facilitator Superfamily